jgi:hypothetical protein
MQVNQKCKISRDIGKMYASNKSFDPSCFARAQNSSLIGMKQTAKKRFDKLQ